MIELLQATLSPAQLIRAVVPPHLGSVVYVNVPNDELVVFLAKHQERFARDTQREDISWGRLSNSAASYPAYTDWDAEYQDAGSVLLGQWIVIQRSWGGPSADRWFEALLNPKLREAVHQELHG